MISSEDLVKECEDTAKTLEKTATGVSIIYSVSIWLAVIIGILMIGGLIKNSLINFIVGGIGLFFTLVPLILKNKIEKIEGYILLSIEFKNLKQDILKEACSKKNLDQLKKLRKKLSKYPINSFVKWLP